MSFASWPLAVAVLMPSVHPATTIADPDPSIASARLPTRSITSYGPYEGDAASTDATPREVVISAVHTVFQQPTSETGEQAAEASVQRLVRQRITHLRYCLDVADPSVETSTIELVLRVPVGDTATISSAGHEALAACLTPLVALWPLPDSVAGSRSRLTLRVSDPSDPPGL